MDKDMQVKQDSKRAGRVLAALMVLFALATVGVGIGWAVTSNRAEAQATVTRNQLENGYRQHYYQLRYNVSNMSGQLNKLRVAASPTMQMQLLGQIYGEASSAGAALSGLVTADDNAVKTTKYINQVGDYCLRLQYTLAEGGSLSQADRDNLVALYNVITRIETALDEVENAVQEGDFHFLDAEENNIFATTVASFESETVTYPALIYDGPFSDALEQATPVGLTGVEVSQEQAAELVAQYLPTQHTLSYLGDLGGKIQAYRFQADTAHGTYYLDITKVGGHLLALAGDRQPEDTVYTAEQCSEYGLEYLQNIGIEGMQAVWASNYNSTYYINYAYTQNDVVCYSDLIVLKIDAETQTLMGVEARNYLMNHHARDLDTPTLTAAEARAAISTDLEVDGERLALIPTDGGNERLTYEVSGTKDGDRYFIYVDAKTGRECKIMRVIDSAQGQLLM